MKSKIRKMLEKLKLISPKPELNNEYKLWLHIGLLQSNRDDSWYLQ